MSKIKITKSDRDNIISILRNYIVSNDEKFDTVDVLGKFQLEKSLYYQRYYFEHIKLTDEFYDYCKYRNIFDKVTLYNYGKPIEDFRFGNELDKSIQISLFNRDEWLSFRIQEEDDSVKFDNWKDHLRDLYEHDYDELYLNWFVPLKAEFNNILDKLCNVIFNFKSINDIYEFSKDSIPTLAEYCLTQMKAKGTTLACINKETVDFVNNYLQANKKVDSEKE